MIDKVFVAVALAQTILTTLRAGSRAIHIFRTGSVGAMDGPPILPPRKVHESAVLWELSAAVRHAVLLEARPDLYETEFIDTLLLVNDGKQEEDENGARSEMTVDVYRLSTFGASPGQVETDEIDKKIEEILLEEEEESGNETATSEDDDELFVGDILESSTLAMVDETPEEVPELEDDVIEEIARTKEESISSFQRFKQEIFEKGKRIKKHILSKWRRFEYDDDDDECINNTEDEEELHEEIASSTSYHTQVDIGAELSIPKTVSLHTYTPEIFRDLRRFFGISEREYLHSVLETGPFISFQSNSKGAARVGGSFFFTSDGTYLIKSIKRDEVGAFLRMLPKYYKFMRRNGRRSLLTRFCGMYEIKIPMGAKKMRRETFVVMNAVFPAEASKFIAERFDLKGSTMGRECSIEERIKKGPNAVLKDMDLAREVVLLRSLRGNRGPKNVAVGLHIGPVAKTALLKQLRRDVELLVDCNLIDYSLLVGTVLQKAKGPSMQDLIVASFSDGMDHVSYQKKSDKLSDRMLDHLKVVAAPPVLAAKSVFVSLKQIGTWPFPYFGSERCGVEAGDLSCIPGERHGRKAMFYFGLIDFLQPFNWKKELEWKWKKYRYGGGFSCVPPDEYAERFLRFLEQHIT